MSCEELQALSVSDEPAEHRRLERHALTCERCAAFLDGQRDLEARAAAWREASPPPPAELEDRVVAALRSAAAGRGGEIPFRQPEAVRRRTWYRALAAAATLAGLALVLALLRPAGKPEDGLAQAVRQVRQAEAAYTRAIAELEKQADVKLARAEDPLLSGKQAVVLLSYRDRLENLDSVIAEVHAFLADSPGNSGGHTVLLAAYKEKSQVLREIIDLDLGDI